MLLQNYSVVFHMHRSQVSPPLMPLYDKIYRVSQGMFSDLNSRNYLRKGLSHEDRQKLKYVWDMTNFFTKTLNYLYTLFDPKNPNRQVQVKGLGKMGMTKAHLTSLWGQSMVLNFLVGIESVFRFTLVFFLNTNFFKHAGCKPKHTTTSRLLKELGKIYPQAKGFDKAFSLKLRNSIAHGAFWFDSGKLYFTPDPHFKTIRHVTLVDLMKRSMEANVGAMAFIDALVEEINKGTFRL